MHAEPVNGICIQLRPDYQPGDQLFSQVGLRSRRGSQLVCVEIAISDQTAVGEVTRSAQGTMPLLPMP